MISRNVSCQTQPASAFLVLVLVLIRSLLSPSFLQPRAALAEHLEADLGRSKLNWAKCSIGKAGSFMEEKPTLGRV